ncbi:hypothetical protein Droror1_Dr00023152 [Drosera rotundifolia]
MQNPSRQPAPSFSSSICLPPPGSSAAAISILWRPHPRRTTPLETHAAVPINALCRCSSQSTRSLGLASGLSQTGSTPPSSALAPFEGLGLLGFQPRLRFQPLQNFSFTVSSRGLFGIEIRDYLVCVVLLELLNLDIVDF